MKVRRRFVTEMARSILADHPQATNSVGAVDPRTIAESLGIAIRFFSFDDNLSGFMLMEDDNALIGVNENDGRRRQRYTIAHELGHYFLHDRSEPFLDPTTARAQVIPRDNVSSQGIDTREIEANLFAAELLMPEDRLRIEVEKLGGLDIMDDNDSEIKKLADQFDVSVRAMTIRLERLGYLEGV